MWTREQLEHAFKARGKRITKQRQIIFEEMLKKQWVNCKEIYIEASRRDPSIGLSTVYRTMRTLEEMGILRCGYGYVDPENEKISQHHELDLTNKKCG